MGLDTVWCSSASARKMVWCGISKTTTSVWRRDGKRGICRPHRGGDNLVLGEGELFIQQQTSSG